MTAGISLLEEETGSNQNPCHVITCRATSMEAEQMRDLFSCRDEPIDKPKNLMTYGHDNTGIYYTVTTDIESYSGESDLHSYKC